MNYPAGYYVARVMVANKSTKLKLESRCFEEGLEGVPTGFAKQQAEHWRDWVQKEQPDHELVVIQVLPRLEGLAPLPGTGLIK